MTQSASPNARHVAANRPNTERRPLQEGPGGRTRGELIWSRRRLVDQRRLARFFDFTRRLPSLSYKASMIADLRVMDPWKTDKDYEIPLVVLELIRMKDQTSGSVIDAWDVKMAA